MEDVAMTKSINFWRGKRVLLTGHTGFKGSWLAIWLLRLGAKVTGISLAPKSDNSLYELANISGEISNHYCDICNYKQLEEIVCTSSPEIVFHLAAQSLVRTSYREPLNTYSTNVMGSVNLLESLRSLKTIKVVVMITTDKVYHANEWFYPYREIDELGGYDPYSASKAASEIVISSYRNSYFADLFIGLATARAGNVIGGGDWSEDRLIPDALRAWQSGRVLEIRRPQAIRPWQHVLEPLSGYLTLAEKLWQQPDLAGPFNFGPNNDSATSVRKVIEIARLAYGKGDVIFGDISHSLHETEILALDSSKSRLILGVAPKWNLTETLQRTMDWYLAQEQGAEVRSLCEVEIAEYEALK
jgi:CDP-glucose 4,6-dehydratase